MAALVEGSVSLMSVQHKIFLTAAKNQRSESLQHESRQKAKQSNIDFGLVLPLSLGMAHKRR